MPELIAGQPINVRQLRRLSSPDLATFIYDAAEQRLRVAQEGLPTLVFENTVETPDGFESPGPVDLRNADLGGVSRLTLFGGSVLVDEASFDFEVLLPNDESLVFVGSDGRDVVDGGGADDDLSGAGGADLLIGLGGSDDILGGAGNDVGRGGPGIDSLEGGRGSDSLFGGGDGDVIGGGAGGDLLNGGGASDVIDGGGGDDRIVGGAGDDGPLEGGVGADTILGGGGNDFIGGGPGNDRLVGGAGNDVLLGDGGNDTIVGGGGDNGIYGGDGNDFINAGPGSNRIEIAPGDRQRADRVAEFNPFAGTFLDPDSIFILPDDPTIVDVRVLDRGPGRFDATVIVSEAGEEARIFVDFAGRERRETATAEDLEAAIIIDDFVGG